MVFIKRIFIGMLFVFLDFSLTFNTVKIGLIPDFLGYYFMYRGVTELAGFSGKLTQVAPYIVGMAIYSGICYALDLLGLSYQMSLPLVLIIGLASTILSLIISYKVLMGIKDIEAVTAQDLNTGQLYGAWKLLAVFSLIVYPLSLFPALLLISIIIGFALGVYYLYMFNKTKNLFYADVGGSPDI